MPNDQNDVMTMVRELQKRIQTRSMETGMGPAERAVSSDALPSDLVETPEHFHLTMDLPGFRKEDIRISIQGRRLLLAASSKDPSMDETRRAVMVERTGGNVARSFDLPCEVDDRSLQTHYDDGVLSIVLKKSPATEGA